MMRTFLLALVLTPLLLAPPQTAAAAEGLSPYDIARLQYVYEAVISPDGRHVAYTLLVPRVPLSGEKDGPAHLELHVADVARGTSRPFITGKITVRHLAWTPDSKAITFLADRPHDDYRALHRIPIDGGEATRVLTHDGAMYDYALSPDGRHAAYVARAPSPAADAKRRKAGFKQEVVEEDPPRSLVYVKALDDPKARAREIAVEGSASAVTWSPDGARLAISAAPTSLVDDRLMHTKVQIAEAATGRIKARVKNPGKLRSVVWSPDGRHVALLAARDVHDPQAGRIMVADARTGKLRELLKDEEWHVVSLAWRDARTIVFAADRGVQSTVGQVTLGGKKTTLVEPGGPILSTLTVSAKGEAAAFVGHGPTVPWEVFTAALGKGQPKRLTNSNPWLKDRRFAKQEAVRYKARDGLELEGILVRPLGEKKGKRYPLIVMVHGGPEAHYSNGWVTNYARPGQMGAARGYAVFYPNYRGSTGRGVAFSKLSQGDPAGKEFDDVVDGVDHLIKSGLVDKDRVGITGGSYGGYATAWGATALSDRFAAGVMFVGISDLISKFGTTDIPQENVLVHQRRQLWDDWKLYLERSPVYHVQKGRTPLLILHGKDDPRVNVGQSRELFRHLKTLGKVPVRLVLYPGEGHGNRRAAARLDVNLRQLRWMDLYLKKGKKAKPPAMPPRDLDYDKALGGK